MPLVIYFKKAKKSMLLKSGVSQKFCAPKQFVQACLAVTCNSVMFVLNIIFDEAAKNCLCLPRHCLNNIFPANTPKNSHYSGKYLGIPQQKK